MKETIRKNTQKTSNAETRILYIPSKIAKDMGLSDDSPEVWIIYDTDKKELTVKSARE